MDLLATSVQFELGELGSEQLPDIAVRMLQAGHDSPALREVAGEVQPNMADTGARFADALRELGVAITRREACLLRAEAIAHRIAAGAVAPTNGGSDIYYLERHFGEIPELKPFLREYWRMPPPVTDAEEAARDALLCEAARSLEDLIRSTVAVQQRGRCGLDGRRDG